jgi:hypothetical protein
MAVSFGARSFVRAVDAQMSRQRKASHAGDARRGSGKG